MNIKMLCLGALCLKEGTGYEIKKLFESAFSHFHSASYGSIYPALDHLLKEGLAQCRVEPGESHPDRKIFRVTPEGRARFKQELGGTPPKEQCRSVFLVLMFFSHLLSTERLKEILNQMETHYRDELDYLNSLSCKNTTPGIRFTIDYGIAACEASLNFIRNRRPSILKHHRDEVPPAQGCES